MEGTFAPIGRKYISYVGATPFYLAAQSGDAAYMRVLAAAGADPKMPTVQNQPCRTLRL